MDFRKEMPATDNGGLQHITPSQNSEWAEENQALCGKEADTSEFSFIDPDWRLPINTIADIWGKHPTEEKKTLPQMIDFFNPAFPKVLAHKQMREDRPLFSCNIYKSGTQRRRENVVAMTAMVLDFDNKEDFVPIESLTQRLDEKKLVYFWYTSYSHTPECPRWRLMIPFAQPVPVKDWLIIYDSVLALLGNPAGIDHTASKDVARCWYPPYKNPDQPFLKGRGGNTLLEPANIEAYLTAEEKEAYAKMKAEKPKSLPLTTVSASFSDSSTLTFEQIRDALDSIDPSCEYPQWIRVGMALHHHFGGTTTGFDLWLEWSRKSPEKFPKGDGKSVLLAYWGGFSNSHDRHITAATIIHYAQENGYVLYPVMDITVIDSREEQATPSYSIIEVVDEEEDDDELREAYEMARYRKEQGLDPEEERAREDHERAQHQNKRRGREKNVANVANVLMELKTASEVDLARHLLLERLEKKYDKAILYDDGAFWRYGETRWQKITYESLAYSVHEYDGLFWQNHKGNLVPIKIGDKTVINVIKRLQTETIERMDGETDFFHDSVHRKRGINCLNGLIEVKNDGTASILSHHKEHRQRHIVTFNLPLLCFKDTRIDFEIDWDQEPWKNSKFRAFWSVLFSFEEDRDCRDKIDFFGQLAGVALSGMSTLLKQPKAVILLGESANNGKSQLLDLLSGMLAPDDVCHIDPEYFSSETRRLSLAHKLLNTVAELSGKALESKHFKEMITGEATDARELYKMPVSFNPVALHIWATNRPASFFGGIDEGVKRRLIIVPFDKPIPKYKQIAGIAKQIIQEEGHLVLAWALKGLMRVIANKDYVVPPIFDKTLENWIGQSDSAIGFTQECIRFEEGMPFMSTQYLYYIFREWHVKEGYDKHRIISKNAFARKLNANMPKGIIVKHKETGNGYHNLRLINVEEFERDSFSSCSQYGIHK